MAKTTDQTLRVAVVTGASRGIGAETARRLAKAGYSVVLAARSVEPLNQLASEIARFGGESLVVPADVSDRDQLRAIADRTLARFGRVDVVLNNAGAVNPGVRFQNVPDGEIQSSLATNLLASMDLTHAFLPTMIQQRCGYLGFVGSVGGHIALPSASLYSTAKFGMRGFAMALRREVEIYGINVCLISPGYIKTDLTDPFWEIMKGYPMAMGSVDAVATAIMNSIARPRREVIVPFHYRAYVWLERNLPVITDAAARLYMRKILIGYEERQRETAKPD
jgi:short-subunit dehydrogenase